MLTVMNKKLNIKFMVLAGVAAVAAGCGNSGSETLKAAAPVAAEETETVRVAPGVYYTELPTGFRLATNYFELDASSAEALRAMAAQDPERAEQLGKEADRLEAGLKLIDRAGGAKAIAQAKGIPQDKGKDQGQTMLGCTYRLTAVPYEEAHPNTNRNGAYAYGAMICQNGVPIILGNEIVETKVVVDGHVYPYSRTGDPYDGVETTASYSRHFPKGEAGHTCSSEARVSATIFFGIELPFASASEYNNRCYNLLS